MTPAVCVYSNFPNVSKALRKVLPAVKFYDVTSAQDDALKQSEIIIGDYDLLAPHIYNLPKAKWIQGTWAGVECIVSQIKEDQPLPFLLTRFSGQHFGRLMAEYTIACIVNHERDFYKIYENQKVRDWNRDGKIFNYRGIADLTIGILGIGNIGNWIGKALHLLGAKILGYGRRPTLNNNSDAHKHLSAYYTPPELPKFLENGDYVINVLPNTPETTGILNGNVLQSCQAKQSVFINIGRANIIAENDLVAALNNGWISAAILDVFDTEPLPKQSSLWGMKQVKITPHSAGVSRASDIAEQFRDNLKLFQENKPIPTIVDVKAQY